MRKVSKILGVSSTAIANGLRRRNDPTFVPGEVGFPTKISDDTVEEMRRLFLEEKQSLNQIAASFGVSSHGIRYRFIKKYGQSIITDNRLPIPTGENHHGYKGGKFISRGYIFVRAPDHSAANRNGYVPEHRIVMEEKIGRVLYDEERVHHIDFKPLNNSPWNLHLFKNNRQHHIYHSCHSRGIYLPLWYSYEGGKGGW
jgi:hypothetical protein